MILILLMLVLILRGNALEHCVLWRIDVVVVMLRAVDMLVIDSIRAARRKQLIAVATAEAVHMVQVRGLLGDVDDIVIGTDWLHTLATAL